MSLGSFISRAIPAAIGFATGGPIGAVTATVATENQKKQEKRFKQKIDAENVRRAQFMEYFGGSGSNSTINRNMLASTPVVNTAGSSGGFFDTVRGGLRDVGGFVGDLFGSGLPSLFGVRDPRIITPRTAIPTTGNEGAQETGSSGSIEAGFGGLATGLLTGARNLLKTPGGQIGIGLGTGFLGSMLGDAPKGMRITRKMKSQARMVLNMTGGNLAATADMLNIDQNTLVMILLKRFRNDGPVVTKAAMRKTKQTIRRLHSMQDVLKSITPTASGRRRAPMKRAMSTTLIKN